MKKRLLLLSVLCAFIAPIMFGEAADVVAEPNWGPAELVESYTVGPGMKYQKIIYPEQPLILWYTVIDLTNPLNKIEQAQSRDAVPDVLRWDVPTFAKENSRENHNVRVAWNHDFFSYDMGICIGANISHGEMTWTLGGRSLLAFTKDKKAEIFSPNSFEGKITAKDGTYVYIDKFNAAATSLEGNCVLFNRMNSLTLTADGKYIKVKPLGEWLVNGAATNCEILEISDSPLQTSATEYIIYLRNDKKNIFDGKINVGDQLEISQKYVNASWGIIPNDIINAFHGYPSIAHDGKFHDGEYNNFESGREYEKSSHVMVGLSQDKTKLHVLINEMSANSNAVDCVQLTSWMILRGAWDVVNFDSGGSAAIVIDNEMLNLPGRGSVRPVEDAMLAVSLAPDDKNVHHLTFSKESLNPSVISLTPLRVLSFNQYDEVLDKDLKNCTFTCIPAELGTVDENDIFHSSGTGMTGVIKATKDGFSAEIPVTTRSASIVEVKYPTILTDATRRYLIEIEGMTETETFNLDPCAFSWVSSDADVCHVENGMIVGEKNGTATLTGTFDDLSLNIDVTVEVGEGAMKFADLKKTDEYTLAKTYISNVLIESSPLPAGWSDGTSISYTMPSSARSPYLKMTYNKVIYGVSDSLSMKVYNTNGVVKNVLFTGKDNLGGNLSAQMTLTADAENICSIKFEDEDGKYVIPNYPITLSLVQFNLDASKKGDGMNFAVSDIYSYYPKGSGIESNLVDKKSQAIAIRVNTETVDAIYESPIAERGTITMFSTTGQQLVSEAISIEQGTNSFTISTKEAIPGIYLVNITTPSGTHTAKCIIR